MNSKLVWNRFDVYACAGLVVVALSYAWACFDFSRFPSEDAAMLMRYAEHAAQGHGIVWNIGEPPVDGATDFLFMIALAGLNKLGLTVEHAVHMACYLSHIATVLLVYAAARNHYAAPRWAALTSAGFLAVGPGTLYTEAYFGTPFFALFVCLTWYAAMRVVETPDSRPASLGFAFLALTTGLVRPEGVLFSILVLLAIVYRVGFRKSMAAMLSFALVFAVLGGAYFVWRLDYFGHPLPNPFYAKGGGRLHVESLQVSVRNVWKLSFPFSIGLAFGWFAVAAARIARADASRRLVRGAGVAVLLLLVIGLLRTSGPAAHDRAVLGRYTWDYAGILAALLFVGTVGVLAAPAIARRLTRWVLAGLAAARVSETGIAYLDRVSRDTLMIAVPVAGFTTAWVLIEDQMNYLMRFQYPILPVILMSWPVLLARPDGVERGRERSASGRRVAAAGVAVFAIVAAAAALNQHRQFAAAKHHRDGRHDVAVMLQGYGVNRYTMATTEAGLLPLYSRWRAVDLLGLNDAWIAHHGRFTDAYLDARRPEVIVIAGPYPIDATPSNPDAVGRRELVRHAIRYADAQGFTLAAAYGADTTKVHYYYVRNGFPHRDEIVDRIRGMTYSWYRDGSDGIDWAAARR